MDIPFEHVVKVEPEDDSQSYVPAFTPSQGLIEFFLDNEYKKDEVGYYYNKVKCLDETDGKFKHLVHLSSNQVKPPQEGDFKNYCSKCDKQFNSLLAAQNHYIFTHPDSSLLAPRIPQRPQLYKRIPIKKSYNWLDEPESVKGPIKNKEASSNIIVIKDKHEYLNKLCTTQKLVQIAENVSTNPSPMGKGYTLESIKARPLQGIKIVKKSDIQFDQLRTQAEKKLIIGRKPELQLGEAPPKKIYHRHLKKIDKGSIKEQIKRNFNLLKEEFFENVQKSQKTTVTYLCRRCNLQMFDPYVFDAHMRLHINTTFTCPLCSKTFSTKIGIVKHTEACNNNSNKNKVVKIVHIS